MSPVVLDYETFYKKNEYSVKDLGNWRYCNDDRFDPYLLSVYDGTESWVGHPTHFNWEAIRGRKLLAHNAGFDSAVSRRLAEVGLAPKWLADAEWQCTANLTSFLCNERALDNALLVLEGRQINKSVRDRADGKHWRDLINADLSEKMARYALADAKLCYGLWDRYSSRWSEFEQNLSSLTMKQCARGVAIDVALLRQYKSQLEEVIFHLERSLPWTERGAKPTSPRAIAEQCRIVGIPAPPVKEHDEEGWELWAKTFGPMYDWALGANRWRSLRKLLAALGRVQERLRPDNTIDFSLLYFGTHTGRWSGGGSGLNMQNLRKEPIYTHKGAMVTPPPGLTDDELKQWEKECTDAQLDVRKLFIARPGKKFIISDLSQIEPRVLNWLAGNNELLGLIANGFAYYEAYAKSAYPNGYKGWSGAPGKLKKEVGQKNYTLLKNEALGCGYQMGPDRYTEYAGVSLEEATATVGAFRAGNPLIVELWQALDKGLRASCWKGEPFEVALPSGRSIIYRSPRRISKKRLNPETKQYESTSAVTVGVGLKRVEIYGGKITENVTQAVARDVFGCHLLKLEDNVGDVIFHAHDEAIVEVDEDVPCKEVEAVMSECPDWIPGLPVAAEAKESRHYLK